MSNRGIFPRREEDFNNYVNRVVPYITDATIAARLQISADNQTLVIDQWHNWEITFATSNNPATDTTIATKAKNTARSALTETLRSIYKDIPTSALTTTDRETLNLKKRATKYNKATQPKSQALISKVYTGARLQHHIFFEDAVLPGKGKPAGIRGCQIWFAIGDTPPENEKALQFMACSTKSPHIHTFNGNLAGKTVHYWVRWENKVGQTGPWGAVVAATVVG